MTASDQEEVKKTTMKKRGPTERKQKSKGKHKDQTLKLE